ncbi:hypothetical protein JYU34_010176 [Plutella xylostella]|uniref:Uncharacterized protein n=1 Tax=Plutella xylostella TaxID=51655 RepID=A0ABQ7QHV5_PLUXY|nr:hypothetical protein JYU34_010176 [Plutella xylostella]
MTIDSAKMKSILYTLVVLFITSQVSADDVGVCQPTGEPFRPCEDLDETCIREYFEEHADCAPHADEPYEEFFLPTVILYLPYFNMTCDQQNGLFGNLENHKIVEFKVNPEKNITILSVAYTRMSLTADLKFLYYQPGKEPRAYNATTVETYPGVILTTTFYSVDDLSIENSFSVSYLTESIEYKFSGDCLTTTDPILAPAIAAFDSNFNLVLQEAFRYKSTPLAEDYVRRNMCDFNKKN